MQLVVDDVSYHAKWLTSYKHQQPTLVCLHGFTSTHQTFAFLTQSAEMAGYNLLAFDLIGHGKSDSPAMAAPYTYQMVLKVIAQLLDQLGLAQVAILGYSMGARVAIGFTISYPERVSRLIIESGTPGLKTSAERQTRRQSDERLADRILIEGVPAFVDFWENLPLFDTQKNLPKRVRDRVRLERLSQLAQGLANSLRFMGTGSMPNYWPQLASLKTVPVAIIVGERDTKFCGIADAIHHQLPTSQIICVPDAGHCVHLERPDQIAYLVTQLMEGIV